MGLTYVDSCVLLEAANNPGPRGTATRRLIELSDGDLATSHMVDLECMVRPLRSGDPEKIIHMQSILDRFRKVDTGHRVFQLAAHIRALHGVKTPDALHLAAAGVGNCQSLWTFDRILLRTAPGFAVNPL